MTVEKKKAKPALLVWGIDPQLKQEFRIVCMKKGKTMKQVIEKFLVDYVARDKRGPRPSQAG